MDKKNNSRDHNARKENNDGQTGHNQGNQEEQYQKKRSGSSIRKEKWTNMGERRNCIHR